MSRSIANIQRLLRKTLVHQHQHSNQFGGLLPSRDFSCSFSLVRVCSTSTSANLGPPKPAQETAEPELGTAGSTSKLKTKVPPPPLVSCITSLPIPSSSLPTQNEESHDARVTEDPFPFYFPNPNHANRPLKLLTTVDPSILQKKALLPSELPKYYLSLSKARLSSLVVMTSLAGYCMGPSGMDPWVLGATGIGTFLVSAGANTINQIVEVPYDSEMIRTKGRVLVRELLSTPHAVWFALTSAGLGLTILTYGANPLTALLGATNLFLYTSVYTPLKRQSILNTWIGSVVGALPPLMGWAASEGTLGPGAYLLGGILFSWQFVHFNSLSWNLRADYKRAGYRMMSVTHPDLCVRTCLRYSIGLVGLCTLAPALGMTHWFFAIDSLPFNCWAIYLAYNFYKKKDSNSSRKLFRFSLLHLPILILLMIISKNRNEAQVDAEIMKTKLKEVLAITSSILQPSGNT